VADIVGWRDIGMILMKALVPSTILTLILSAVVGVGGTASEFLKLHTLEVAGHSLYWSWPFFVLTMALFSVLALQVVKEAKL
jgi:hypothetical protein